MRQDNPIHKIIGFSEQLQKGSFSLGLAWMKRAGREN